MEKTALGLIAALGAAVAAPACANAAASSTDRVLNPTSIAELLEPVADPVATLEALNSGRQLEAVEVADNDGNMQVAETVIIRRGYRHHYHHHHHHHFYRRFYHHHHHHHWRRHHRDMY